MRRRRIAWGTLAIALVGASLAAAQTPGQSIILERILVRVNGEIFTQGDLTQRQTDAVRDREPQPQSLGESELFKLLTEVTPDILVNSVDELLIVQHGRQLGLVFSEEEFQRGLETLKKDNNLDDAGLKKALQEEGLTLEELRKNFEHAWLRQMVQAREIFPRMRITEEEMRQYYASHRSDFMTDETVMLRELAVLAPASTDTQSPMFAALVAGTRERVEALRKRALAGEDFEALVKEASDAATKANGGLIGPIVMRDLNPIIRNAIEQLEPGGITEPIAGSRGYQIFKVESREAARQLPFSEVRDRIEVAIRNERLGGEMEKLRARLRASAVIEWKDENLRRIYERRLAELTGAGGGTTS